MEEKRQRRGRRGALPDDIVGMEIGGRVVLEELPRSKSGHRRARVRCKLCGDVADRYVATVAKYTGCNACKGARRRTHGQTRRRRHDGLATPLGRLLDEARERCPAVWLGDDPACVDAVAELVGLTGACSLAETGILLGVTRERIRQIEHGLIRGDKLRRRAIRAGLDLGPSMQEFAELHAFDLTEAA